MLRHARRGRQGTLALIMASAIVGPAVAGSATANTAATVRVPADHPTIQAALDAAQVGDTVLVSPGTYNEAPVVRKSLTLASEYLVTGQQSAIDSTIIELPAAATDAITVQGSATPKATIVGFTVIDSARRGIDGIKGYAPVEVLHNRIVGLNDAVDVQPGGSAMTFVVRDNVIEDSVDDAIDLNGPSTGVIEGNLLRNSGNDGIEIRLGAFASRLEIAIRGNTITGSDADGIQLIDEAGASDRLFTIERNVFAGNGKAGLGLMDNGESVEDYRAASLLDEIRLLNNTFVGGTHAVSGGDSLVAVNNLFVNASTLGLKGVDGSSIAAHNLFWGNGANASGSNVDAATTTTADPRLAADYTLQDGSPAIDAGTASYTWQGSTVLDLQPGSYVGSAPDLGALESAASGSGPETTITSAPPSRTNATTASFAFTSSVAGATFECALDGAALASCTTPVTYTGLAEGPHTFAVRATDPAGVTDPTPASASWTVDTTPPQTTITSAPPSASTSASATFVFSASEAGSTFACALDGAGYEACDSPKAYGGLANGPHTFAVRASDAAGNVDPSPASHSWSVTASSHVLAAAGDIADCSSSGVPRAEAQATAALLDSIAPDAVLPLGDNAYETGTIDEYLCGYQPTWGRHLARTYPVPGNHEYLTANAAGYFSYFGARAGDPAKGYYSYDLGNWHVVALNSECSAIGGCGPGSPQETWLREDLAATTTQCIAGYWHKARFSSGKYRPGNAELGALFQALYDRGADLLLVSHDHNYERFARQSPGGALDLARGIRQFVVGTGGAGLYPDQVAVANSEARSSTAHGVLKVTLRVDGYDWQFVPVAGQTFADSGSDTCGGSPPDTAAPASPSNLAGSPAGGGIDLAWSLASDNVGVVAHDVYRNGSLLATTTAVTSYRDTTVASGVAYTYTVRARDAAGNPSGPSNSATVVAGPEELVTFFPVADTHVKEGSPTTNYGTATTLETDLSPDVESFLRFSVSGLTRPVTNAKLRLYVTNGTSNGPALYSAGDTWSETTATWNTKPARTGGVIEDKGAMTASTWVEYAVGPVVLGNGTYTFTLVGTHIDGADFRSRQATSNRPELVLTLGAATPAPETTIDSGPSGTVASGSASFTFSSSDAGATFSCSLDGAAFAACSSPYSYSGLADGSHTFQVRATDGSGNTDPTPASRTWSVDTTPPNTSIDSGPSGTVASATATFTFSASEPGSSFECALDGAAFAGCSSPTTYSGLAEGAHTFQVRARDAVSNLDPTPASRAWSVDTSAPPAPVITSPPNGASLPTSTVVVAGTAEPQTTVTVLDGGVSQATTAADGGGAWQLTLTGVPGGSHTYTATARDAAGNTGPASSPVTVTVDVTAPETTIDSGPSGTVASGSASFTFSSSDAGATFSCSLDGAAFAACSSPYSYSGLADGSHTFQVRATDGSGNTDPTPASRTWSVDTTPPNTSIDSGPSGTVASATATFTFSASEPGSSFECALDGAAFAGCSSPTTYSGLAEGAHTFQVRARDAVSNLDPTPASRAWSVDTSPPAVLTFGAEADARVEQGRPSTNFGTATTLIADTSPQTESFLRFTVTGVTGTVTSARLRLYVTDGTSNGPALYGAGNSWTETGITWSTRPARIGGILENKGNVSSKAWVEYDVRSAIAANGTYTFTLAPESSNGLTARSKEASSNRPLLVVTVD